MFKNKKSVSPIITVVLLIIISVVLVTIILNWGKIFTTDTLSKVDTFKEYKSLNGFIIVKKAANNKLLLYNDHPSIDTTIVGYKIRSDKDNFEDYSFLNKLIELDTNITFNKKKQIELDIICFPENKFSLDLVTIDNKYVPLQINTSIPTTNSCLNYGLVAHWDFKDIGTLKLTDKTNRGNDCNLINSTINEFWSKGNGVGYFNGSNYANCGQKVDYNAENFTLSVWVKPYYLNNFPDFAATGYGVAGTANYNKGGYFLGIRPNDYFYFAIHSLISHEFGTSSLPYVEKTWLNFVLTYDGTTAKGYINSEMKINSITEYIPSNYPFYIGDVYQGGWDSLVGEISDVRFYNRALNEKEIIDFYNSTSSKYN